MIAVILALIFLTGVAAVCFLNIWVIEKADDYVISAEEAKELNADCIIVLGALVYPDGSLSDILRHRVMTAVELFNLGASNRLLMSGDNSRENYNESAAMKAYAVKLGVPSEKIFQDYAGFSTYETMYRARDVFRAKKVIIVTQKFHISRAVYLARSLGLEAYGVICDRGTYQTEFINNLRETGARVKAVYSAVFQPKPTYLGDAIPISGNGDDTDIQE